MADTPEAPQEALAASNPAATTTDTPASVPAPNPTSLDLLGDDKIARILDLTANIDTLTANIRNTKRLYDKYDSENQYLQDYIGTLMNSDEIRK